MTTVNEALGQQAPQAPVKIPSKRPGVTLDLIASLGVWAFFAWLAGVALGRGFGVSVPFIPALLLAVVSGGVVKLLAGAIADTWQAARVKADTAFLVGQMMAQAEISKASASDLSRLFADLGLDKPAPGAGGNGYL